jgi:nucleoid-associated protein YgaU
MTGLVTGIEKPQSPAADTARVIPPEHTTHAPLVDQPANGPGGFIVGAGDSVASGSIGLAGDASAPQHHVVHNGDTLGRLAKRYLGDESRSLEIFDLNRDVLSNPHLLPIGAELRIPAERASIE